MGYADDWADLVSEESVILEAPEGLQERPLAVVVDIDGFMQIDLETYDLADCFELVVQPIVLAPRDVAIESFY